MIIYSQRAINLLPFFALLLQIARSSLEREVIIDLKAWDKNIYFERGYVNLVELQMNEEVS